MVQPSFFVAMTAIFSIAANVQAIPINVDIDTRDGTSENVLEARMFRKVAGEVGKEVYGRLGDSVLHGGVSLSQLGPSNSPGPIGTPTFKFDKRPISLPRPGPSSLIPKIDPIKHPTWLRNLPSVQSVHC